MMVVPGPDWEGDPGDLFPSQPASLSAAFRSTS